MPQADSTGKRKGRAKNNLSTFDIGQIEADLMAVESEALKLDPQSLKNEGTEFTKDVAETADTRTQSVEFKPRPVNVVNFNPDNSKLLHKVLRADQKPKVEAQEKSKPKPIVSKQRVKTTPSKPVQKGPQALKVVSKAPASKAPPVSGGMDGFKKATPLLNTRPVNLTSVALTGMRRANQFNRYALEQHKTSLQNQIEKESLFEKSLDSDVEIYDMGLETNRGKKVYNVRRRKSMLGGVDQHNLGSGKVRRVLGYRSMKFLMPVFAVLIVGAYVMYLNMPTISIKVAESKSGVAISEPSYTPDGYRLSGPIEADTGQVAMSFKNGDSAYNVSQKVSDWDSKALLENKILKETKEYSAYTDRGLTIYVYDGKATWVNQGKVYEIELNDANLDVEEMIRIAGSM